VCGSSSLQDLHSEAAAAVAEAHSSHAKHHSIAAYLRASLRAGLTIADTHLSDTPEQTYTPPPCLLKPMPSTIVTGRTPTSPTSPHGTFTSHPQSLSPGAPALDLRQEVWARGPRAGPQGHVNASAGPRQHLNASQYQELKDVCGRALYHALRTSVHMYGPGGPHAFVQTGDIPDMWIRDSAVQLGVLLPRVAKHPALRQVRASPAGGRGQGDKGQVAGVGGASGGTQRCSSRALTLARVMGSELRRRHQLTSQAAHRPMTSAGAASRCLSCTVAVIASQGTVLLLQHHLPGNVRGPRDLLTLAADTAW
jgi:hypothetical protein